MRALLQMTMETEDTTERLSAPTVPSWNFSPATSISTPPQQQEKQSGRTRKTCRPQSTTSTCEAQRSHFDRATAARTPRSSQEPAFPAKTTSLLQKNRIQPNEAGSGRRARESELSTELVVARGPERRAGAGQQGPDRVGLASRLRSWPSPSPSPAHRRRRRVFYTKRKKRYCCAYMVISGWWWLLRGRCVIIIFIRGDQGVFLGSIWFELWNVPCTC